MRRAGRARVHLWQATSFHCVTCSGMALLRWGGLLLASTHFSTNTRMASCCALTLDTVSQHSSLSCRGTCFRGRVRWGDRTCLCVTLAHLVRDVGFRSVRDEQLDHGLVRARATDVQRRVAKLEPAASQRGKGVVVGNTRQDHGRCAAALTFEVASGSAPATKRTRMQSNWNSWAAQMMSVLPFLSARLMSSANLTASYCRSKSSSTPACREVAHKGVREIERARGRKQRGFQRWTWPSLVVLTNGSISFHAVWRARCWSAISLRAVCFSSSALLAASNFNRRCLTSSSQRA